MWMRNEGNRSPGRTPGLGLPGSGGVELSVVKGGAHVQFYWDT